jgi:hypothetical protein
VPYAVYRGKKGKTKVACSKKKASAKKKAAAIRNKGGHARIRKVKSCS